MINLDNTNEINNAFKNTVDEYSQFKFNVPGNSVCNDSELTAEMSNDPKGKNKKKFLCILPYFTKQNSASFGK